MEKKIVAKVESKEVLTKSSDSDAKRELKQFGGEKPKEEEKPKKKEVVQAPPAKVEKPAAVAEAKKSEPKKKTGIYLSFPHHTPVEFLNFVPKDPIPALSARKICPTQNSVIV